MKRPNKIELQRLLKESNGVIDIAKKLGVSFHTVVGWLRWSNIKLIPQKEILISQCMKNTDGELATLYKVTEKTIDYWKKHYKIYKTELIKAALPISLTDIQEKIVVGSLLGDAHLEKINVENRCKNSNLLFEQCDKHEEYVEYLHNALQPFSLEIRKYTRKNPFYVHVGHKEYLTCCRFRTIKHEIFTMLRKRWYPHGKKIVPKDIKLTWRSIAIWFCDDGSNSLGKRCRTRHAIFCTNGFRVSDVRFLVRKLYEMGIKAVIRFDKKHQPLIVVRNEHYKMLMNKIYPYVIKIKCMHKKLGLAVLER